MIELKVGRLFSGIACAALIGTGIAAAPSVRHDFMDVKAAKRDIRRLQKDRHRAVKYHNWAKVAQDDRLIASDRFWIQRDSHRIKHAGG
jgi:hypothetical protein